MILSNPNYLPKVLAPNIIDIEIGGLSLQHMNLEEGGHIQTIGIELNLDSNF